MSPITTIDFAVFVGYIYRTKLFPKLLYESLKFGAFSCPRQVYTQVYVLIGRRKRPLNTIVFGTFLCIAIPVVTIEKSPTLATLEYVRVVRIQHHSLYLILYSTVA